MLSPDDWHGRPPKPFVGSYRLQADMSWTPADTVGDARDDSRQLVARLLAATGDAQEGGSEP